MSRKEYTVKNLLGFAEEVVDQDSEFVLENQIFFSLFTDIPPEETIDIFTNTHFENNERVKGLSKSRI